MTVTEYIDRINNTYKTGRATENSYRGDLQYLLESLAPDVMVTNEPARVACGAPDYIITKKNIPIGYIEAKDIGKPLDSKDYKEQFDRYRGSLSNLIITDYLEFRLFHEGTFVSSVSIGEVSDNKIHLKLEAVDPFKDLLKEFYTHIGQTIKSASQLSKMMAGKARLLANVVEKALSLDENDNLVNEAQNLDIYTQYSAFKAYLIHDIKPKEFADVYAQTIAYGMFAARLNDPSLVDFSRQEAAELIPKSNPFLRNLFQQIAGYNFDDRIKWIVDALADIFRATNVAELLKDFGKSTQQHDPMIHFYETFLAEYDPKLRKSRGVYYTPEPVVNFIVRAVDDILKTEFNLPQGLADTSKIKVKVPKQGKMVEQEVHKVQILDPAAGTGTFLAEVVKQVYNKFEDQHGVWSNYVEEHLIPRLNGFEILMAPYTMAHLKLDLLLKETGYVPKKDQRLKFFLTNSLEEFHPDTGTLFAGWLSSEANEANHVKRDTPVMVVLGNPPYSLYSKNLSESHKKLIEKYRYINGERIKEKGALQLEKNLNEDCVKFIAFADDLIRKNNSGIIAFINTNNFLDAPTLRGMRWNLLKSFNKIIVIDLHGNSNKKEVCDDGSKDENVFDIQQGVSISLFIKNIEGRNKLAKVFHSEVWGARELKYNLLSNKKISEFDFNEIELREPEFVFKPRDYRQEKKYLLGFKISDLFLKNSTGIVTARDNFTIDFSKEEIWKRVQNFISMEESEARRNFNLGKDSTSWKVTEAIKDIKSSGPTKELLTQIDYRPFDTRWTYYTGKVIGFYTNPRKPIMKNFFGKENYGICFNRRIEQKRDFYDIFIFNKIIQHHSISIKEVNCFCPLYIYEPAENLLSFGQKINRAPNLNESIIKTISTAINLNYTSSPSTENNEFNPLNILDYIYAVLHSPKYRSRFNEFLKNDFPRVPYPKDKGSFWKLVNLGSELRQIHLLESPIVEKFITTYPVDGSNEVDKVRYEDKKVWINAGQYFDKVPQIAWEFYIGGYQPAQKWLKDRKGRTLSFDDIQHYQKIIVALSETDRIMKEIDQI
jgi:predicted helicase